MLVQNAALLQRSLEHSEITGADRAEFGGMFILAGRAFVGERKRNWISDVTQERDVISPTESGVLGSRQGGQATK